MQEQVCGALCTLGESQPAEVLSACEEHLRLHEKVFIAPRGWGEACGEGPAGRGSWRGSGPVVGMGPSVRGGACRAVAPVGLKYAARLLWVESHTGKSRPP